MARIGEAHIGARFGQLTVTGEIERRTGKAYVPVRCDCGTEKTLAVGHLGRYANSCGCVRNAKSADRFRTHGLSKRPEYISWLGMVARCTNPDNARYADYGGRGITIAPEWANDFEAFFSYIGPKPGPTYSVDRIDNDRGYEPGNVRWATPEEQAANQRRRFVCKRGHAIEGDNEGHDGKSRRCLTCMRENGQARSRAYRARKKANRAAPDPDTETTLTIPLPAR